MVQHLRVLQLLLDQLLWQDHMAQISHQIGIDSHLYQLSLLAEDIDEFDAHSFDIERCILAEVE